MIFNCKRSKRELSHKSLWDLFWATLLTIPWNYTKTFEFVLTPREQYQTRTRSVCGMAERKPSTSFLLKQLLYGYTPCLAAGPSFRRYMRSRRPFIRSRNFRFQTFVATARAQFGLPASPAHYIGSSRAVFFRSILRDGRGRPNPNDSRSGARTPMTVTATQMTEGNDRQPCRGTELLNFSSAVVTRSAPKKCDLRQISAF